ncbi:NAD-dependent epimerase/dehydratase family protein [Lachnoclostridium sp. Marseille-P6806]|uniref:NAD-dependent epimerase/dehydratase family protein n=1 Tax=Lachnoclostridium sp. Marseille-P6806 TaxID=2364793 RepID=UPI00102F903A|nr:NAD-dependent epimerase/dehydratase family protein [Lachnoclostridium sp. Marseille-P6806]
MKNGKNAGRVLFLGGPGNISESAIRTLLESGHSIGVVKRTATGLFGLDREIEVFYGDCRNGDRLQEILSAFGPDMIVDSTCFELSEAKTVAEALKHSPCRRLVFISTADVYGYPLSHLPMREGDPWNQPNNTYARNKKEIEIFYREELHDKGIAGLTIVRPGYSMGKTFALGALGRDGGAHIVSRIRRGLPVYSPGDGTTLIDAGAAFDTGRMLARLCEEESACGQAYNCANPEAVTYDEYLHAFGDALGLPIKIVHIPTDFLNSLDHDAVRNSTLNDLSRFNLYFSVEKFRIEFPDFVWKYSLKDAAGDFVEYQDRCGGFEEAGRPCFEDALIELWEQGMDELRERAVERL